MRERIAKIKANTQDVVFVTTENITRWAPDPDNPAATQKFLDEARQAGWPVFELEGVAYVYATEVRR